MINSNDNLEAKIEDLRREFENMRNANEEERLRMIEEQRLKNEVYFVNFKAKFKSRIFQWIQCTTTKRKF